jgi:hypothetical protein
MFTNDPFYFNLIRKYVITFGTLFNSLYISRETKNGKEVLRLKVPINYSNKDKALTRIFQDPNLDRPTATAPLPMMAFEITGFRYDASRKLQTVLKLQNNDPDDSQKRYNQYVPVPYNIDFQLNIFANSAEDATKIVEQILPYFTPDWTVTAILVPELDVKQDIPIVLNSIQYNDIYEGDFKGRRTLIWTLDFTMKGVFYGPVRSQKTIKYAITQLYTTTDRESNPTTRITVQPGLTANGQPTSNAALSIPVDEILATDDFGFVVTQEDLLE